MECNEPGTIHNEELLAYLAGEPVRPLVVQHITKCHHCSSQVTNYRQIELMLTSKLYRWDCPPNQILGEYQLGLLTSDLATAVKIHLSTCVLCTAEVATLNAFLANDPMLVEHASVIPSTMNNHHPAHTAEHVLNQIRDQASAGVRRIIAAWQPTQPRLAFQREIAASAWPRRYTAEDVNISIQIERGKSRTNSLQLIGFVTRSGAALEALQGTPVLLSSQTSTMHNTQNIDELGNFIFPSLTPATYTLELQFPENTIVIDQLSVSLQD